ncbi:hypothetical protein CDG81_13420 [Actinopolyspora erythraea]|uniref:Uncharacterized protein n=1 Tax=Actinopolyspora erythraea TaxID=414996 RepID=A0A099D3W2_9ACTN|nr:hypothetical protein CDG81_13420 [Actinopolyspora erythraea]KGI80601.1 hypothetical protein IL38_16375 [Actinopolyspora erythraea]
MVWHKLCRAMVNPEHTPLADGVEVDKCYIGGYESGECGVAASAARGQSLSRCGENRPDVVNGLLQAASAFR